MILQLWSLLTAGSYVVVSLYAPRSWDLVSRLGLVIPCGSALTVAISYLMKGRTLDLAKKLDVAPGPCELRLSSIPEWSGLPAFSHLPGPARTTALSPALPGLSVRLSVYLSHKAMLCISSSHHLDTSSACLLPVFVVARFLALYRTCSSSDTAHTSETAHTPNKQPSPTEAYSRKLTQSAQQGTMPQQVQTAVEDGNVDRVRAVMDAGINVNACTAEGKAMLHLAAQAGQAEVIRLLLSHSDNRADIHARDADGRTALHLAAAAGQGVGVKILLERGAPLEAKDLKGLTPLELAKETGHRGCELLMKRAMDRPLSSLMASEKLTQRLAPSVSASPV